MSDVMRKKLYVAAHDAIADECRHVYADAHAIDASLDVLDDRLRCPDCLRQAVAAVRAMLTVLVDEHFPDDDVEYIYACEGLAMDACEVLREIRGEG
jgi:hypothetical protein